MTLKEFVKITYNKTERFTVRPRIVCEDGFSISIQGSDGHYCTPRQNLEWYVEMEVGFPSEEEPLLNDNDGDDVFGYVSVLTIEKIIKKHGGINIGATFK